MEENLIQYIIVIVGAILANISIKLGRAWPLIKQAFEMTKAQEEARRDKVLTRDEKAMLYDKVESLIKEAYALIKGFFPNKSK